ncbi:MAG: replicative DNA helicase [Micrococcaceae bacterium]
MTKLVIDMVEQRTPPQDINAEQSVLGGMLLSKDAIAEVSEILKGADFYRPAHELIFNAIVELFTKVEPADAITVTDELTKRDELSRIGGATYIHELISVTPTAANATFYARIVQEKAVLRRLVEAGNRITQLGFTPKADVESVVDEAQAEIYSVNDGRTSEDYVPISEALQDANEEIEAASNRDGQPTGIPTGFTDLDEVTHGLHGGQMIVIAARPAMGKSTLALDFARSATVANNMPTVFFSLEMGRTEIAMRMISAQASIPLSDLRKGTVSEETWVKIARVQGKIGEAPLYIDDSPNMTLMEIRAKCRRLKQQHGLKMVVIDYLQLMSSGKNFESRQQEVSEFSRSLKLLAKELDVPVVALSQLNRASEQRTDKRPMISDLRESGSIEQDADIVLLLHRPEVYDKPEETDRPGEADLILAKHRNGPTKTVAVAFQGKYSRFRNMANNFG